MKHFNPVDGIFLVLTDNDAEKERFKTTLRGWPPGTAQPVQPNPPTNVNPPVLPEPVQLQLPDENAPPPTTPPADPGTTPPGTVDPIPPPDPVTPGTGPGSEVPSPLPQSGMAVPTFHNMGLYLNRTSAPAGGKVWVRFRKATEPQSAFKEALPLWYDSRTTGTGLPHQYNCRGSVFNLAPNTKYVFEFGFGASYATAQWQFYVTGITWSEVFKEAGKVNIPAATGENYTITDGGSFAAGYKVYDGGGNLRSGVTSGGDTSAGFGGKGGAIHVKASYVIIRNVKLKGAWNHGIYIEPGVTDVIIEYNDISEWCHRIGASGEGRTDANWGPIGYNGSSGVWWAQGSKRIVVQYNKIHDPKYGSNAWDFGDGVDHPAGPNAVTARDSDGQCVIRYNEIYANPTVRNRWFNDPISFGPDNFTTLGLGPDSDVYGNIILHGMDDSIEAEGGGANVRIYGNYINYSGASAIATTIIHFGPIYIFRNVHGGVSRYDHFKSPDEGQGSMLWKSAGVSDSWGKGRKYYFHNTTLQAPGSSFSPPQTEELGVSDAASGLSNRGQSNTVAYNNILHVKAGGYSINVGNANGGGGLEFDYDIYNGGISTAGAPNSIFEPNGFNGVPTYKSGHGWSSVPVLGGTGQGNYQLADGSLGKNAGKVIPNINDASSAWPHQGAAPDVGAHEDGLPSMKFGLVVVPAEDTDTGGESGTPIQAGDIVNQALAEVPFNQQSGYNTQLLNQYLFVPNGIPETGMHAFAINGETIRFGKYTDPANAARKAFIFALSPNDVTTSGSKRCEIKFPNNIRMNTIYWCGLSVYVYDWGTLSTSDNALFGLQQHNGSPADLSPNFSIVTSQTGRTFQILALGSSSSSPSYGNTISKRSPHYPIPFGQWTDFVFRFKLNTSGNGFLDVWQNGAPIYNFTGILGYITPGYLDFFKFGYYNWSGSNFASPRKILIRTPVIISDATGNKYTHAQVRTYVNAN